MTLVQHFPMRTSLLAAICFLIVIPVTTLAGTGHRNNRSVHAEKHVTRTRRAVIGRAYAARRRRAEAQRQAAIAHQRALDGAMRNEVQGMISRDDISGEDEQVRRVADNGLCNHEGDMVVRYSRPGRVWTIVK